MENSLKRRKCHMPKPDRRRSSLLVPLMLLAAIPWLRADAAPPKEKPATQDKARPTTASAKPPEANVKSLDSKSPKAAVSGRVPRRVVPEFEMNPDAKWACEEMTYEAKPVWSGAGRIEFPFKIRNVGTAPLQIRAKGG